MPKVECVKDVIMESGDHVGQAAFLEGKIYKTYQRAVPDYYEWIIETCAKNEFGKPHIIGMDSFFKDHFRESV